MSLDAPAPGPAGNLLRSLVRLGGSLLAAAETRFDLLATELNEDVTRGVRLLAFALAALFTGLLGALMAGATGRRRPRAARCCTSMQVCTTSTRKNTRNAVLPAKPLKLSSSSAGTWLMP